MNRNTKFVLGFAISFAIGCSVLINSPVLPEKLSIKVSCHGNDKKLYFLDGIDGKSDAPFSDMRWYCEISIDNSDPLPWLKKLLFSPLLDRRDMSVTMMGKLNSERTGLELSEGSSEDWNSLRVFMFRLGGIYLGRLSGGETTEIGYWLSFRKIGILMCGVGLFGVCVKLKYVSEIFYSLHLFVKRLIS